MGNRTWKALIKPVIKLYSDVHTLVTTDPKPRPRRGSQQLCTHWALTLYLLTASRPALQNTHQTPVHFQTATGKEWSREYL